MAKKKTSKKSEQLVPEAQGGVELQSGSSKSEAAFDSDGDMGASKANVLEEAEVDAVKAIINFLSEEGGSHFNNGTQTPQEVQSVKNDTAMIDEVDYFNSVEFKTKQFDFIDEIETAHRGNDSSEKGSACDDEFKFSSEQDPSIEGEQTVDSSVDLSSKVDDNVEETRGGGLEELGLIDDVDRLKNMPLDDDSLGESLSTFEGSELEGFESASIEELEFIEDARLESIIESVLFATDRPVSIPTLKQIFKGTNVTNARLKKALDALQVEYAGGRRGITLEEVGSGYQLRTKVDNMEFLRRSFKVKSFKLSGPALEVLAITAYKQPVVKAEIDEIRGVESGHLLRALMEKNLVLFAGKSDLPGKPMQYATTRKFLEIFGLRNLKELPTLSQIDELLPEGIGDEEEKPKLADITEGLSEKVGQSYSEGEEELNKISDQLEKIDTSSEFFEKEKLRQKQERESEKARNIREAIAVGEDVPTRDRNWLKRYEEQLSAVEVESPSVNEAQVGETTNSGKVGVDSSSRSDADESEALELAMESWDQESDGSDFSSTLVEAESSDDDDDSDADSELLAQRFEDNDIASIDEEV